jgi:UDP-3-O-[3-hydroxymyristoyl] glucosamine N-acyltransferase
MSFSVSELVSWTGGRVANEAALGARLGSIRVERPAPLGASGPADIAFFFNREYEAELPGAKPGVLLTGVPFARPLEAAGLPLWSQSAVLVCEDPYLAMAVLSGKFAERASSVAHLKRAVKTSVHPSAVVHPTAELGEGVQVGPNCVIADRARIGAGTVLYPSCFVGPAAVIGEDCVLFPSVVVYEWTQIGSRVRIHANSTLGSDGFGYAPRKADGKVTGHQKIFHLGRVIVGDDAELGANCCVDRGTFGDTVIGRNAKLDNQVHVGHNATVEEGAILCGGTCLAGSSSVGKYAYVGGLTGIANKVHVGDGASVGACSLLTKDVPPGTAALGNPQREYREHFKAHAALNRLMESRRRAAKKD